MLPIVLLLISIFPGAPARAEDCPPPLLLANGFDLSKLAEQLVGNVDESANHPRHKLQRQENICAKTAVKAASPQEEIDFIYGYLGESLASEGDAFWWKAKVFRALRELRSHEAKLRRAGLRNAPRTEVDALEKTRDVLQKALTDAREGEANARAALTPAQLKEFYSAASLAKLSKVLDEKVVKARWENFRKEDKRNAGVKLERARCGMTAAEVLAIMLYTGVAYEVVNQSLRAEKPEERDELTRALVPLLDRALSRYQPYQGKVRRGSFFLYPGLATGATFSDAAYASTSAKREEEFPGHQYELSISKGCVWIAPFSANPDEDEVLCRPGKKFEVTRADLLPSGHPQFKEGFSLRAIEAKEVD